MSDHSPIAKVLGEKDEHVQLRIKAQRPHVPEPGALLAQDRILATLYFSELENNMARCSKIIHLTLCSKMLKLKCRKPLTSTRGPFTKPRLKPFTRVLLKLMPT